MNKVLITGGSGLLALNWALTIREECSTILGLHKREVALDSVGSCFIELDTIGSIEKAIDKINPDIIIHTAGLTSIEQCESSPKLAESINTTLAANMASVAAKFNKVLVHISTDNFFSGFASLADETAKLNPINKYGQTKALAENAVLENNPNALIVRTNFYGWGPSYRDSFSDMIINTLRNGNSLDLFEDVFYTPILIERLVGAVHELIELNVTGICNVVGDNQISKYDFGLLIAKEFELDSNLIRSSQLSELTGIVQRPNEMGLSNKKVTKLIGEKIGGVEGHIVRLREQERFGVTKEITSL